MAKVIAPAAINSLKEALTAIYWYKDDLRHFLIHALDDNTVLNQVNWNDYKRNIVSAVVEHLARNQGKYWTLLLKLMVETSRVEDFSHLLRLDAGEEKARRAKEAVAALKQLLVPHEQLIEEERAAQRRRSNQAQQAARMQGVREALEELKQDFFQLIGSNAPQQRGYQLEKVLRRLFDVFDLDPKASFRVVGEQIDGAFTFDKTDYLFEGKWQADQVDSSDLDGFSAKVSRKLDNTLGLFLSINGFSQDGITAHSKGKLLIILMDGADLMAVLEGRIDLVQLLLRKRRTAAQTGNIYLKATEILTGG